MKPERLAFVRAEAKRLHVTAQRANVRPPPITTIPDRLTMDCQQAPPGRHALLRLALRSMIAIARRKSASGTFKGSRIAFGKIIAKRCGS